MPGIKITPCIQRNGDQNNANRFLKGSYNRIVILLIFFLSSFCEAVVIKTGMTLSITVKDDPALTAILKVKDDGTIDYPLYQDIPVTDKTTSELQDILTFKLAKVIATPLVLVSVIESPMRLYVLGQVKRPGLVSISPQASLQEALLAAEGPTEMADLEKVKIVHKGQTDEDASYFDLQKFLSTGNLDILPHLQDGDRIVVLASKKSTLVKVLGAVNKPGFYPIAENASVFDVLYLAGGPSPEANLSRVRLMGGFGETKYDTNLDFQKFVDAGKTEEMPLINPGDVIIVYQKTFTWSKALTVVRDIVTLVTAWLVITQVASK